MSDTSKATGPATTLDGLPWRAEPPDVEGWWWLRHTNFVGFACHMPPHALGHTAKGWTEGWRCCPVVLP